MTLVLEPVDYTLNYYLHQLDKSFSVLESITVVQQISSAALYLQECGYIHSNISSHNVLVRERPLSVKLSSFELATDVDCAAIRAEVEINYPQWCANKFSDCARAQRPTEPEEENISCKEQYMEMSKRPPTLKRSPNAECEYMAIPSKYLIYDTIYRQRLSMHNFVAPELLTLDQRFVFPTPKTDVYSLCLLLWELLNQCVPFAVYSKFDMERMIATEKLNLPFFERQRCYFFMDVFRAGLAVRSENRTDVPHLIEMLEDIELEILTGGDDSTDDENHVDATDYDKEDVELIHGYVNFPQQVQTVNVNDTVISSLPDEAEQLSGNNVNSLNDFILSPSSLDFDKSLSESERTSTKKLRKKPPRKFIKHQIHDLFTAVEAAEIEAVKDPNFVKLNESFREISDGIRRTVFDDIGADEKLNENLAVIADDIRRNILNDTSDVIATRNQPNKIQSKVNESSIEQQKQIFQHRKTTPAVVGFSMKAKKLNDSKTYGNYLDTPVSTSGLTKQSGSQVNIEGQPMPTTPLARQNYNRRNAWLSLKPQPSSSSNENETERRVKGYKKEASPLDDDRKVNVSVRIVHNKITPKKVVSATEVAPKNVDEGRPSILSKIKFFNSATDTSKTEAPVFYDKHPVTPVKADEVEAATINYAANYSEKVVNERVVAVASDESVDNRNVHSANDRKTIINELKDAMLNMQKSPPDQPQLKQSFENKWKRELDICNRSLNSSDGGIDSKVVTSKFRSVRDTIMKFEKRGEITRSPSSSHASPTELVKSAPKTSQHNPRKPNDSPTLIKRTIYSERIMSGVDLSPLSDNQMPMFDKFNFGSQKVATRVSLRQVRQTSSDVGVSSRRQVRGTTDVRHTICGSEMELLSFNAGTFNSPGAGPPCTVTKYVCFNCASRMSSDELKACKFVDLLDFGFFRKVLTMWFLSFF